MSDIGSYFEGKRTLTVPSTGVIGAPKGQFLGDYFSSGRSLEGYFTNVGPVENFFNSVLKTVPYTAASYQALFNQFEESEKTRRQAEMDWPTRGGVSGFVGQAVGGILPTAGAIIFPPAAPFVLGHYALQSGGTARQMIYSYEKDTGTNVSPGMEAIVTIGFGAATFFAEKMGLKMLNQTLMKAGIPAIRELGEAAVRGGVVGFGKALLKTGLIEGGEEFVEQVAQNALTSLYDADSKLFKGTGESFALGFLGGAMLAPIGYSASYQAMRMDSPMQVAEDAKAVPRAADEVPEVTPVGVKPSGVDEVRAFLETQQEGKRLRVIPEAWLNRPIGTLLKTLDSRVTWGQMVEEGLVTKTPAEGAPNRFTIKNAVAMKRPAGAVSDLTGALTKAVAVKVASLTDVLKQVAAQKEAMQRAEETAPKVVTPGREEGVEGKAEEGVRVRPIGEGRKVQVSEKIEQKYGQIISGWFDVLGIDYNLTIVTMDELESPLLSEVTKTAARNQLGTMSLEDLKRNGAASFTDHVNKVSTILINPPSFHGMTAIEVYGHETGHIIQSVLWKGASPEIKSAVKKAYERWADTMDFKSPKAAFLDVATPFLSSSADLGMFGEAFPLNDATQEYMSRFNEWFAWNVDRWALSNKRTLNVVDRFFKSIADKLRQVYASLAGKQFLPDAELATWLDRRAAYVAGESPPPRAPVAKAAPAKPKPKPKPKAKTKKVMGPAEAETSAATAELTDQGIEVTRTTKAIRREFTELQRAYESKEVNKAEAIRLAQELLDSEASTQDAPLRRGLNTFLNTLKREVSAGVEEGPELTERTAIDEINGPFGLMLPAVPGPHNDTDYGKFLDDQYGEATKNTLTKAYFTELKKKWKTRIWDVRANVRLELDRRGGKLGQQAMMIVDCQRGASASAINKVHIIEKDMLGGLTVAKERLFADICQAIRTIEVETNPDIGDPNIIQPGSVFEDGKLISKMGAEKAQEYLDAIPDDVMAEMLPRKAIFTREFRKILEYGLGAGLIAQKDFANMIQTEFYSPRWLMSKLDPTTSSVVGGKKIQVTDSGFEYLDKGSTDYLVNDPRLLLTESWARIIARDYKNRANASLYDLIIQDPENGMVIEDEKPGKAQPEGWTRLAYLENGAEVTFLMRDDLAREWVTTDKAMRADLAKTLYLVMGTKVLKMTATGYNPGFAVTNFFRDISLIWFATKEYSPNILKGIPQLGQSLAATMKDAWTGSGSYNTYMEYGGGLNLLTQQGQLQNVKHLPYAPYINRGLNQVQGIMGKLGNFTEMWNRLALMNRALKNMQAAGKDISPNTEEGKRNIQEAVWIARTYLDFDQGGSYSKAADPVIPYIGASVQATRGLLRSAQRDPATFAMKSAQLGALAAGLVLAARAVNKDAWDDITDEEKNRYFIITTPFTHKDKDGNKRHVYYRIAKDQGQRALSAIFEGLALMSQGEEFPVGRLVSGIGDALPIVPGASMLAPTMKGLLGILFNKDFYRNEDIWKGTEVYDKTLEVSRYTQPGYIKLAEAIKPLAQATGVNIVQGFASPERLQYATGQLFARGNPYSWLMGSGFRDVISQLSDKESEDAVQEVLARVPMIRRVYRVTYPDLKPRQEVDKLRLEGNDYMVRQRRALDALVDDYLGTDSVEDRTKVNAFIRSQPNTERDKLRARFMWARRTKGIANRRWWLDVAQLSPETRALAFLGRSASLAPQEMEEFDAVSRKIPGFRSPRFVRALRKLRRQETP